MDVIKAHGTFVYASYFVSGWWKLVPYKLVHRPYSPHNTVTLPNKVVSDGLGTAYN